MELIPILLLIPIVLTETPITCIRPHKLPLGFRFDKGEEHWRYTAIEKLWQERQALGYTPMVKITPKGFPNADIFLKNETASPSQTLKHRFAWTLLMWAIVEGKVGMNSSVYDSTSGNTGSSEAYMCTLVGLQFTAVVANEIEQEKVDHIMQFGGKIMKVNVSLRNSAARAEAAKHNGFFINQFGNADHAEEFHESGTYHHESVNVFHEILNQLEADENQVKKMPDYFIHSAGTGGTISSVGRYIARYVLPTRVLLADSEFSLFYDYVISNKFTNESGSSRWVPPGIAGIGYGYDIDPVLFGTTTSLARSVIHEAMKMPDIASTAAMHVLRRRGYDVGASTALNFLVSLSMAYQHRDDKTDGRLTVVTIVGDPGYFYDSTYHNDTWLAKIFKTRGGLKSIKCWEQVIEKSWDTGSDFLEEGLETCTPKSSELKSNENDL